MKKKSGTEYNWILFSVVVVVVPFLLAIVISVIISQNLPPLREVLNSIILIVFSVACSLLSICVQVYKQKKEERVIVYLVLSGFFVFIAWTFYVISLVKILDTIAKIITIVCCLIIIFLSYLGIKMGKQSDKNENEVIQSMHSNCEYIRNAFISKIKNDQLKPFFIKDYDLLCNPDEFNRVRECIQNIIDNTIN